MRTRTETAACTVLAAMALAAPSPGGQTADPVKTARVNGVELAYVDHGRGEAVVLVHGAMHDYRIWAETWPELAKRNRVIAYSRRHHHPNPPAGKTADYSLAAHAADLVALLDELKLDKAHLVGHSAGANVAALVARRHPGRVRKLVLGEPFLPAILARHPEGQSLMPAFFGTAQEAFQKGDVPGAARILADGILGPGAYEAIPAPARQILLDNLPAQFEAEAATPPDKAADVLQFTCDEAGRIEAPTLLLMGEKTARLFWVAIDEVARCMPGAARATLPRASHALEIDNPAGFVAIVQEFLSAKAPSASTK
ncbi:MAG TPA: alpha/beta hydrolase [Vicinamibacteria bacterium]|nr:alpha/beta hydrolase [Vicinamibacteria bacterium]